MELDFIPYSIESYTPKEQKERVDGFFALMNQRRTVRTFSSKEVPQEIIEKIIMTASTAPSGAHKQPWHFCAISSSVLKKKIRKAAEEEEYLSYNVRMSKEWKEDLKKLKTNWDKPFLEKAPWLIAVFLENYELKGDDKKLNYYVKESIGLATGILLSAIFNAGLASLTYTPSPMRFLGEILNRPKNQKPYLLIPVGYPEVDTVVPDLKRKKAGEVITYYT